MVGGGLAMCNGVNTDSYR